MPRFLALDWDAGHAHLLAASVGKGGLRVEQALAWPEDQPPLAGNAEAFGQRLRERLKAARVGAAPLLVAVGRDRLTLKDVRYPDVPPHEEPGVVRFQTVKELTEPADQVVIDYQASETPEPSGERKALAVVLRRDQLQAYQTLARAAGLKLVAVTPRAYGAIACLRRTAEPAPEPDTAFAVLTVGARGGEFVVARGDQLAFARALSGPALASDAALLGEIRRNLAVYAGQSPQHPVRALYVAEAGDTLGVGDRLRDTLAIPVYRFDPLSGAPAPEGSAPGSFAGAAGLLFMQGRGRALPVNFVKPREPKPPRDPNRRVLVLAASVVGLLMALGAAFGYSQVAAKDRKVAELREQKNEYDELLLRLEPDEKRINALDAWNNSRVVYLDELYDLTARFPSDLNRLRLSGLTADAQANKSGKGKLVIARINLDGLAVDERSITSLSNELVKDYGTHVSPKTVKGNTSGRRGGPFPLQWKISYETEYRKPEDYTRKFTATPPPRKSEQRQQGGLDGMFELGGQP